MDALQGVADRVKTLERIQREQGQAISSSNTRSDQHQHEITAMKEVINSSDAKMRKFLDDVLYQADNSVDKKLRSIEATLEKTVLISATNLDRMDEKLKAIEATLGSIMHHVQMPQGPRPWTEIYNGLNDQPQVHSMATPPELAQPTGRHISGGIIMPHPIRSGNAGLHMACEVVNRQSDAEAQQTAAPLSPFEDAAQPPAQSWATAGPSPMGPNGISPFEQEQLPQEQQPRVPPQYEPQTPNNYGRRPQGPPYGPPGGYGGGYGGPPPPGGGAISASFQAVNTVPWQASATFVISRKKRDALKKFSGTLSEYGIWKDRVLDHLCRTNRQWRHILEKLQVAPYKINKQWLMGQSHCGFNAWELSETLEAWLVDWLSDSFYRRRKQLSGGENGKRLRDVEVDVHRVSGWIRCHQSRRQSSSTGLASLHNDWWPVSSL